MCIMASPVRSVSDTRIFVGTEPKGLLQLTVYQMAVELSTRTGKGNAMILPVPVGTMGAGTIQLVDLSSIPDFFDSFIEAFIERSRSMSKGISMDFNDDLEVQKVGNYDVSVVPSVDDVKRLNRDVFEVSPDTEALLRAEYPVGFAFLVAQLRNSGEFHPLAYVSPVIVGKMFIPTKHAHGRGESTDVARWDHHIFYRGDQAVDVLPRLHRTTTARKSLQGPLADKCLSAVYRDFRDVAPALLPFLGTGLSLNQVKAEGLLANIDLTVSV